MIEALEVGEVIRYRLRRITPHARSKFLNVWELASLVEEGLVLDGEALH